MSFPDDMNNGNVVGNWFRDTQLGVCANYIYKTLLKFDVSAAISGKNIRQARLRMYPFNDIPDPGEYGYRACGTNDWPPNSATAAYNGTETPGTCSSWAPAPRNLINPIEWDVTALVRKWASGEISHQNIVVGDSEHECPDNISVILGHSLIWYSNFESLEYNKSPDRRPQLYIEWE